MREIRRCWFPFLGTDYKAVQRWLDRKAAQGWELEEAGPLLARFRRTGRRDLRCCVDIADQGRRNRAREEYLELCAQAGWVLVDTVRGMNLFKSKPGSAPAPIHTDPALELARFGKKFVGTQIAAVLTPLIAGGLSFALRRLTGPPVQTPSHLEVLCTLTSSVTLMCVLLWAILFVPALLLQLVHLLSYWLRSNIGVRRGGAMPEGGLLGARIRGALVALMEVWGLLVLCAVGLESETPLAAAGLGGLFLLAAGLGALYSPMGWDKRLGRKTLHISAFILCATAAVLAARPCFGTRTQDDLTRAEILARPVCTLSELKTLIAKEPDRISFRENRSPLVHGYEYTEQWMGLDNRLEQHIYACADKALAERYAAYARERLEAGLTYGGVTLREPAVLERIALAGIDEAWAGRAGGGSEHRYLILRRGNVTAQFESSLDLTRPDHMALLLKKMDQAAG